METGIVVSIDRETKKARIHIEKNARCGSCQACHEVNTATMTTEVDLVEDLAVGDTVQITTPPTLRLKAGFLLYMLPLISFIAAFVVVDSYGFAVFRTEETTPFSVVAGLFCMGIVFYGLHRYDKRLRKKIGIRRIPR